MSAQMMQRLRELVAMQSPAIQVTAPSPELLMTPVIPNLPGNDALVSPGAAAASGSSGSSGAAKRTPKARRLLSLQFEPSESSRVVKVKVTVTHISNPVEETICTVIGMSSQGAALAYTRLSDGATCVYIADEKILPQGIRKKIVKADSKIADRQPPANAERLEESDFTACMLKRPSGGSTAGYVCTRKGPLFGVTCDSAMVTSLTHVGFWRRLNQSYNYCGSPSSPTRQPLVQNGGGRTWKCDERRAARHLAGGRGAASFRGPAGFLQKRSRAYPWSHARNDVDGGLLARCTAPYPRCVGQHTARHRIICGVC
jgi:hypothetical protein